MSETNEVNTYNKSALIDLWRQAIIKSLMAPAQRLLDGQTPRRQTGDGTTTLIKIIPLVIISLSLASVTNMASRAWSHHASYSSYAIGLGLAIMVPVIVFTALRLQSGWASGAAWWFAIVFAFASGSIQFQIYNTGQPITLDSLFSFGVDLEALAFGFGVPFAECVLAALEGLLVWQIEAKGQRDAQQSARDEAERVEREQVAAKAAQDEAEQKERVRLEWQAEQERKRAEWQAEQERKAAEHAQRLELQRQKAVAKQEKPVAKSVAKPVAGEDNTPAQSESATLSATERRNVLIRLLDEFGDIGDTEFGNKLNVDRTTIFRDFQKLQRDNRVHQNGGGWAVGPKPQGQ